MEDDVNDNSTVLGYKPLYNPVPIYGNDTEPPSKVPICVEYIVATDKALGKVVRFGTAYTSSDVDYTLKVSMLLFTQQLQVLTCPVLGRGGKSETIHAILLSIQCLRIVQHESDWANEDDTRTY